MRKILLVLFLVLSFAGPAGARVVIDGAPRQADVIMQDDRTFVPLRFIAESFGYKVDWDGSNAIISTARRPDITGEEQYRATVEQALDLLKWKDPIDHDTIIRCVREIYVSNSPIINRNGESYATVIGLDEVSLSPVLFTRSLEYVASTIVHESTHLRTNDRISVKDSENIAYQHQISVLKILSASQSDINLVEEALRQVMSTH